MSDTPPPELVERLVPQVLRAAYGAVVSPAERIRIERVMPRILAALAEWADGGLIDPSTWTVVEAKKVARVVHDAWSMDGLPMEMHAELTDPADCCDGDPLWLLSPREGER